MSEQKKGVPATEVPVTEVDVKAALAEVQQTGSLSQEKFMSLLTLMMAKETRIAAKEAELEVTLKARNDQRKKDSENYTIAKIENQKNCKHLKGGKGRTRGQQKDPAVYAHTFTDGSCVIKCQLCSARWMSKDTSEYLYRNGSAIPNWTGIGWREAQQMVGESSNRPSSSERFGIEQQTGNMPKTKEGTDVPNLQI